MTDALDRFADPTRRWFEATFARATAVQARGWQAISSGEHALLLAPTGSGKTLAAFLACLDRLLFHPAPAEPGVRVLYVSPLKALAYDVEKNLRAPLAGIDRAARELAREPQVVRVAMRTGDTSERERRAWAREPGEILVTTPESLYLLLGSRARDNLRTVDTVIVDEVHALAPTKRGAHLALSLERLAALTGRDPQRIGLSATARPVEEVARYLGGDRPVRIVDATGPPALDLEVVVPVPDMGHPERRRAADPAEPPPEPGMWSAIVPELVALIRAHRTTLVFVNSRALCERLVARIDEQAREPLVRAHHGSLSLAHRREVEELLKSGNIRGIVATSSLELGIDMGAVDLVVLVESPGGVARGLQRVGRAGHAVGEVSKGRIFPKHAGDLLEATVVAGGMREGAIEPLRIPQNPLDVLAQQLVAACALEAQPLSALAAMVRRAASFAALPDDALLGVLDMLSGRYPSTDFAELRPRLVWDRHTDILSARAGSRMLAIVSGGTIPDRGLFAVHLGEDGPRVGELDEEMVHETQPGHVITLGASSWRVEAITRDRVIVSPAPGEVGRMPFWRGEGPGRPIELGRALGAFLAELEERVVDPERAIQWLMADYHLDRLAAENLVRHAREQLEVTGALPTDRRIVIERFQDEVGDQRVCILSPFGARVHAPWALGIEARLSGDPQILWSDDGICLRLPEGVALPAGELLFPGAEPIRELVESRLADSALFASRFRENAARALLLPRRRPGSRTPLWQQRLKAQRLLAVARGFPDFPMVVETYRECLQDVFDMPALAELLEAVARREVRITDVHSEQPSPFARSLVFAYVAAYLYQGDVPAAERRAQALSIDRRLLAQLLGEEHAEPLLDPEVIAELEAELQGTSPERRARDLDAAHDRLRRQGALCPHELAARFEPQALAAQLVQAGRALAIDMNGPALIAIEDAGLYRDALGIALPPHVPAAFLTPVEHPLRDVLARWARSRGPFTAEDFARAHGLSPASVEPVLRSLADSGRIVPAPQKEQWCDAGVLRRIKRLGLQRLRAEVEPVPRACYARFLPQWHGIDGPGRGLGRLEEVLVQLEGMPLSYRELERSILPARVADFSPRLLDELGAMGKVVWVGAGEGRVALFRRTHAALLLEPPPVPELPPISEALLTALQKRGACFFADLEMELRAPHEELAASLWQLVWAGLVTNDTFGPLRAWSQRGAAKRSRKSGTDRRTAGRWSLTAQLLRDISPTERAHARAWMLLERHGIVTREAASLEALPGGFSAVYPIFRSMEEAGKLRRGYFVEGLGGAQFALPGAVDRLRALRRPPGEPGGARRTVTVLSAADPANPYGWILPWPELASSRQPKRAPGALLVLVDGEPVLYLDGRELGTFLAADRDTIERAIAALDTRLRRHAKKSVRIESINAAPARTSPLAPILESLGLTFDPKGFVIERDV